MKRSHIRQLPRDATFDPAYIGNGVVAIGNANYVKTTIGPRGVGDACCSSCAESGGTCGGVGGAEIIAGVGIIAPVAFGLGLLFLALRSSRPRARR